MLGAARIFSGIKFNRYALHGSGGFTLLELMIGVLIVGLLAGIALPTYRGIMEQQKIERVVLDLSRISHVIERYRTQNFRMPETLDELVGIPRQDPWGNDYRFLNFSSDEPGVNGKIRKDHNLHPLNSEYDLYSMGPDGRSSAPLTARASRDDIVWARDGSYIGVASGF